MKRIRVLQLLSGFAIEGPLGGLERFGVALAEALDQTHFEPIVCGLWAFDTPTEAGWRDYLRERGDRRLFRRRLG